MLTVTTNTPGLEDKHLSTSTLPELFVLVSLAVDEVDAQQAADGDAGSAPADPDAVAVDPADESDAHVAPEDATLDLVVGFCAHLWGCGVEDIVVRTHDQQRPPAPRNACRHPRRLRPDRSRTRRRATDIASHTRSLGQRCHTHPAVCG